MRQKPFLFFCTVCNKWTNCRNNARQTHDILRHDIRKPNWTTNDGVAHKHSIEQNPLQANCFTFTSTSSVVHSNPDAHSTATCRWCGFWFHFTHQQYHWFQVETFVDHFALGNGHCDSCDRLSIFVFVTSSRRSIYSVRFFAGRLCASGGLTFDCFCHHTFFCLRFSPPSFVKYNLFIGCYRYYLIIILSSIIIRHFFLLLLLLLIPFRFLLFLFFHWAKCRQPKLYTNSRFVTCYKIFRINEMIKMKLRMEMICGCGEKSLSII